MSIKPNSQESGVLESASQLHYADSRDPDIRYLTGMYMPDSYLVFTKGKRKIGVATINEYTRMVKESSLDEVLLLEEVREQASSHLKLPENKTPDNTQIVRYLAEKNGIRKFRVGSRFSAGLLTELQKVGIEFDVDLEDDLLPQRKVKTEDELKRLRKANRASAEGFRLVEKALAESKVSKGVLVHKGKVLTSEKLRQQISHACLDEGAISMDTIVAIGDQACDSHCAGYGPIRAGELIVVDIFPQRIEDGYWGDMTRTYL
ncbi:MAG TPA: M24 family metallopeptidase, partial [Opitutales bacterium]|nr:M24 family metallopeptidase [Opitutales bacterium]